MSDPYANVVTGALKMKGKGIKKKKKKKDKKDKVIQKVQKEISEDSTITKKTERPDHRTPAQKKYDQMQEKRKLQNIMERASKTHKQRVEEFNRHLDSLTEHYDIPKVSWTK